MKPIDLLEHPEGGRFRFYEYILYVFFDFCHNLSVLWAYLLCFYGLIIILLLGGLPYLNQICKFDLLYDVSKVKQLHSEQ